MSKKFPSQPNDTTGAGPGKNGYSPSGSENKHSFPKKRQDGQGSGKGPNAGDHLWKYEHSVGKGPGKK